jgi:hypothetical protein
MTERTGASGLEEKKGGKKGGWGDRVIESPTKKFAVYIKLKAQIRKQPTEK